MSAMVSWLTWLPRLLAFGMWFAWAVITSNIVVLRDNLTPGQSSAPGIAAYATRCRTDSEITMLAALITLTPGTLTMGTHHAPSGVRVLYVHGLYATGADALRSELEDMETRMLHAVRRTGDTA